MSFKASGNVKDLRKPLFFNSGTTKTLKANQKEIGRVFEKSESCKSEDLKKMRAEQPSRLVSSILEKMNMESIYKNEM